MTRNFALTFPPISTLKAAAIGFSLVWILGLAIPVPMLALDGSDGAALAGHELEFALRSLLVHGLAAISLVVVSASLGRRAQIAGLVAAGLSLMQWVLETAIAAGADTSLIATVNHLDGLKMLALAGIVVAGAHAVPRWLRAIGAVLAPALIVSAAGYGLLIEALAPAAYVSLPLLLVWITGAGLSRR
jgi:hypothetical protein